MVPDYEEFPTGSKSGFRLVIWHMRQKLRLLEAPAVDLYIYISRCHGNREKTHIYKLKEGSSRLDWDITGFKKPLIISGALKSCYITPKYGRCEDNNVGVNILALLHT